MSDTDSPHEIDEIREHEHVDPETVIEEVKDLFGPDNECIPPPNPDDPPPQIKTEPTPD